MYHLASPVNDKSTKVQDVEEYKSLQLKHLLGFPGNIKTWNQLNVDQDF